MFTPVETTIGALLLHQATRNLLYQNGKILGASGFLRQVISDPSQEVLAFFAGMVISYIPLKAFAPQLITNYPTTPMTLPAAIVTLGVGALVGLGTKMSNGCTSGHMLCGLARRSGRSALAVAIFFPVAVITHHFVHPTFHTSACPGGVPCYVPIYPSPAATASLMTLATISVVAARMIPGLIAKATVPSTTGDGKQESGDSLYAARVTAQFFSGLLFALGLHVSQMSHPGKVASFLSFPVMRYWDPSLALVVIFGVLPNLVDMQIHGFSKPPTFAGQFSLPKMTLRDVDLRFVAGAAIFGIGWGCTGTCPGPAVLRALFQPAWGALWIGGFWLGGRLAI